MVFAYNLMMEKLRIITHGIFNNLGQSPIRGQSQLLIIFQLFLILVLFFNGYGRESSAASDGKTLYYESYGCNTCHRIGNDSGGIIGPDLIGPDLTFIGFRKNRQWLDLWLKNPAKWKSDTSMQNFFLDENTRKKLVDYLVSLNGKEYQKNPPWNEKVVLKDSVNRGKEIYDRTGCTGCHGKDGIGGYPNNNVAGGKIPSLTLVADGYSKEELKDKIRKEIHPKKENPKGDEPIISMPAWGKVLKENELYALVDYLYSLRPEQKAEDEWTEETTKGVSQILPSGDSDHGRTLFTGIGRLEKRGPSCIGCHSIAGMGIIGGGVGRDLTIAFTKFGEKGITSILNNIPFPTMSPIFKNHPLTKKEQVDIKAFLQTASESKQTSTAVESIVTAGVPLLYILILVASIIAIVLLTLISIKTGTKKVEVRLI